MTRLGVASLGAAALLLGAGGVVASGLDSWPQDAQQVPPAQDVTADLNRQQAEATQQEAPPQEPPVAETLTPAPAPSTTPLVVPVAPFEAEPEASVETAQAPEKAIETPAAPDRRQRRRVALIEAVDKVTAERMRFEVEVGGRPVRFQKTLIFSAKACEVSTPDELVDDAIAYLEVSVQPRGVLRISQPREIFRGWMFASSPAVSGIQHPSYDAWVVGCRA